MKETWKGLKVEVLEMEDVISKIQANANSSCTACGGCQTCTWYGPPIN